MGRTPKFEPAVRRINGPAVLASRRCYEHFDGRSRPIPIQKVPREKRTGKLSIYFALSGLEINAAEQSDVFPQGVGFSYQKGCEVALEVFPRGRSREEYERWQRNSVQRVVPLTGAHCPLMISDAPRVSVNGAHWPDSDGLHHMQLIKPQQLTQYLSEALPLLGVEAADVQPTIQRIRQLLQQGKRRIEELTRR